MDGRPIDESIATLVRDLTEAGDLDGTVDHIVRFACDTVGADHAGISLLVAGGRRFESLNQTDPVVGRLDDLQHSLKEGPCVEAAVDGRMVRSTDLVDDPRWPRWGPEAAALGVRSILSIELHARGQRIGALNLYRVDRHHFDSEEVALARLFAYHAASALAVARNEESLREALDSRTVIGQAQGILMERFEVDAEQAFNVLRRYSQHSQVKLVDIARSLVGRRELPQPTPPGR